MQQQQLYHAILENLENGKLVLPTLPDVALKVRDVVENPNATASQLAEIIVTDAALSARLLKIANSALYRGRVPVESVQAAVSRLGLNMVRNLVTSLVLQQMFKPSSKQLEARMRELWEHSTKVAAISQVIAAKVPTIKTDEAMLAGLIHSIGVLPILMRLETTQDPLLKEDEALNQLIISLHPKIGEAILKRWEFPANFVAVAAEHQNLNRNSSSSDPDLVDVVQVAYLQSQYGTQHAVDPVSLQKVAAFQKLNIDTGFSVVELDENSEEYAEALALFSNK